MAASVQSQIRGTLAPKSGATAAAISEPAVVRWLLIGIALVFLGIFLFLPLAIVFATAFQKGVGFYLQAFRDPDTLAAIRLTLLAAGIAVPLNVVFGIAAAWVIGKFEFRGQEFADHADRPAIFRFAGGRGIDLRLAFWPARFAGTVADRAWHSRSSLPSRESCWRRFSSRFHSSRAN